MCHCVFCHTLFPGAKAKGGTEDWVLPHEDAERGTLRAEVAPPFRASPQTCRRMCCMLSLPRTPPSLASLSAVLFGQPSQLCFSSFAADPGFPHPFPCLRFPICDIFMSYPILPALNCFPSMNSLQLPPLLPG